MAPPLYLARQQESPSAPKPLLKPLLTSLVTRPCLSFSIRPSFPALARWAKRLIGTETIVQLRHNKQRPVGAVCLQAASSHTIPSFSICFFPLYSLSLFHSFVSHPPFDSTCQYLHFLDSRLYPFARLIAISWVAIYIFKSLVRGLIQ